MQDNSFFLKKNCYENREKNSPVFISHKTHKNANAARGKSFIRRRLHLLLSAPAIIKQTSLLA